MLIDFGLTSGCLVCLGEKVTLGQRLKRFFEGERNGKRHNYVKSSTPTGLVWDTNMAAVLLFWDTNMAAMTSRENTLYFGNFCPMKGNPKQS